MLQEAPGLALVLYVLSVFGLANAIAVLKIGRYFFGRERCREENCPHPRHPYDLRRFLGRIPYVGDLFYCTACLGFWIGMAFSKAAYSVSSLLIERPWLATVSDGLIACAGCWLLFLVAERLGHGIDL